MKKIDKKPLVSIVIPVYNAEKYVKEAIQSALDQTYKNIEVICADDCSTDDSVGEINSLVKKFDNVKLFKLEKNSKTSAARNLAIANSNGEYILPLDADDKIHPEYVAKAIKVFEKDRSIGVVYCKARKFGASDKPWKLPNYHNIRMMYENLVHCSGLYRKSDWEKYDGYCELLKEGLEDWDFWLNFTKEGRKFYRIEEGLLFYRIYKYDQNRTINAKKNIKNLKKIIRNNHPKLYTTKNHLIAHLSSTHVLFNSIKNLRRGLISFNLKKNKKLIRILGIELLNR